jgi:hypothetical protein
MNNAALLDPWTIIGYLADGVTPVRTAAGGAPDEDDDDGTGIDLDGDGSAAEDEEDEDDADEDEDSDGGKAKPEKKPAATGPTQADIDALREAQGKRNREHRTKIRELQAQLRAAKAAGQKTDDGTDEATVKAIEAARADAERLYKPVAVRNAAKAGFMEAGLNDLSAPRMTKLLRLLDLDDIEVDEDGEIKGLDDQIDQIKDEWPELFRKPEAESDSGKQTPRIRAPKGDAAGKNGQPAKPKTTGELYAQRVLGNA